MRLAGAQIRWGNYSAPQISYKLLEGDEGGEGKGKSLE